MSNAFFPLTGWQEYIIGVEDALGIENDFVRDLLLTTAIRIEPGIDARRLGRAFQKLCARHDVFRSQYRQFRGKWGWAILDEHPIGLTVHDHAGATQDQIAGIVRSVAMTQITVHDPVLSRLDLFKFGPLGDALLLRIHHGVSDGYGFMVAVEDLIGLLIGLPLLRGKVTTETYMQTWGRDKHSKPAEAEAYWRAKLLPPPPPAQIGRAQKGMPPLVNGRIWRWTKNLQHQVDAAQTEALHTRAQKAGLTAFGLAYAAFLKEVSRASGADDMIYGLTLGRSDGALGSYAGHHSLHPLMRCRGIDKMSFTQIAKAAKAELVETLPNLPFPAGRKGSVWDERIQEAGGYPYQFLVGTNMPSGLVKASSLLGAGSGLEGPRKVGRYTVTPMQELVPAFPGDLGELTFRLNASGSGSSFALKYDADAYSDEEVMLLADNMFAALDIAPSGKALHIGTPQGEKMTAPA